MPAMRICQLKVINVIPSLGKARLVHCHDWYLQATDQEERIQDMHTYLTIQFWQAKRFTDYTV